jgi:hypothetical protein
LVFWAIEAPYVGRLLERGTGREAFRPVNFLDRYRGRKVGKG